ncbi:MAG: hypothetical protein HQL27_09175 [Candidatus Omnitrophica bacterium]|nr:hypothetical protein [Candidatus Omnitrophota bacterium]
MKRILPIILFILFLGSICLAQENAAVLSDGKIVVEAPEGAKAIDYNNLKEGYAQAPARKVFIKDSDEAKEAIKVFKSKGDRDQKETVWMITKQDGSRSVIVEREYSSSNGGVVFSSDGNYAFYLDDDSSGTGFLYGLNLLNQQLISISQASNFHITDCPQNKRYIAVQKGDKSSAYYIYDFTGNSINTVQYTGSIDDIKRVICY